MSGRRRALLAVAATASLLAFAPAARAMGGQDCAPETLAPVDSWLAKHPFVLGPSRVDQPAASACKTSSQDRRLTIVAVAYDAGQDYDKNLVVALVDTNHGAVRGAFKGVISEDATLQVLQGSLRLDTAPYDLAPGVRAFGIDVSSGRSGPRCGEAWFGATRTLFVQEGAALRPVLNGFMLSEGRLVDGLPCTPDAYFETTTSTIAIASTATHGFADLVVTDAVDSQAARRTRTVMRYDGLTYRAPGREPWAMTIHAEIAPARTP